MRIAMIGTGYVGLVSGACFADFGHKVTCVDKDSAKIESLNAGRMPIWEPGLEALVKSNEERGRLKFTTNLQKGIANAEAVFIAVGTPARRGDGHADLTVDAPDGQFEPRLAERDVPGADVVVDAVDQRPIEVEEESHG